jgi:hypothetical protein
MELESLVVPAANAAEEAGNLINNLKNLWANASMEEQRKLLLTMLDAVYIDARQTKSIVAIWPKPPFKPIFQVAVTREGSDIRIINEPIQGSPVFLVETGEGLYVQYFQRGSIQCLFNSFCHCMNIASMLVSRKYKRWLIARNGC